MLRSSIYSGTARRLLTVPQQHTKITTTTPTGISLPLWSLSSRYSHQQSSQNRSTRLLSTARREENACGWRSARTRRRFGHTRHVFFSSMAPDLASPVATTLDSESTVSTTTSTAAATVTTDSSGRIIIPEQFWKDLEHASTHTYRQSLDQTYACRTFVEAIDADLQRLATETKLHQPHVLSESSIDRLVAPDTLILALKCLLRCQFDSITDLSVTVRHWERYIGLIGRTPLTDHLSLRLLTANARAGNLGRCLSLLELRARQNYTPRRREFVWAVWAIPVAAKVAASLNKDGGTHRQRTIQRNVAVARKRHEKQLQKTPNYSVAESAVRWKTRPATTTVPLKNIFVRDLDQPAVDNPTRWLDAILMHMAHPRHGGKPQQVTVELAREMLLCYVGSGYTGKASHFFYKVGREPVRNKNNNNNNNKESTSLSTNGGGGDDRRPKESYYSPAHKSFRQRRTQVKLKYHAQPVPYYKVPSLAKNENIYKQRWERELDPEFSPSLAAAFSFADSLQLGACGLDPVVFDIRCYNALIKASVYRGALWRAMHVMDRMIPSTTDPTTGEPLRPNLVSYNLLLAGLARVGDVATAHEYFNRLVQRDQHQPDYCTVRAMVDVLLNTADAPGAITFVQDAFNQHSVVPRVATHCKILEFCLARNMVFEAKRYVYFIQQIWLWEPRPAADDNRTYHAPQFVKQVRRLQRHKQLQKPALQELFAYFGASLNDTDFL